MFYILGWIVFGLVVGTLAKMFHRGEEPSGWIPTIAIGIIGSYIGGIINWIIFHQNGGPFTPSGILMGTIGGIIFCWIHNKYLK